MKIFSLFVLLLITSFVHAENKPIKVGLGLLLSGELAVIGDCDRKMVELYLENYKRHDFDLIIEDAGVSSQQGLRAYQKLLNLDKVDIMIAGGSSNGILSVSGQVNKLKVPTIMASTGGGNIDEAGEWLFRLGNSDRLNGVLQAELFIKNGHKKIALLTELTDYTTDIAKFFEEEFVKANGELVFTDTFLPGSTDFRSQITKILASKPDAIFMPSQTGVAFGIFMKQLADQSRGVFPEVHTTMVAAPNPDAHKIAGKHILGSKYMDPAYNAEGDKYKKIEQLFLKKYGSSPVVPFHASAVIDSLELVQVYLDRNKNFSNENFKKFILQDLGEFCGYMGCYTFDQKGNSNLGFRAATIEKLLQ